MRLKLIWNQKEYIELKIKNWKVCTWNLPSPRAVTSTALRNHVTVGREFPVAAQGIATSLPTELMVISSNVVTNVGGTVNQDTSASMKVKSIWRRHMKMIAFRHSSHLSTFTILFRPYTSRRQQSRLPPCPLVNAFVPLKCSNKNSS